MDPPGKFMSVRGTNGPFWKIIKRLLLEKKNRYFRKLSRWLLLKNMTGHLIWVVTETDYWYCVIKKWMHNLHGDNKLEWLKVYRWLVAVCFNFIAHAHAHVWIFGRQTLIALIIGQHLCLCFYCLLWNLTCACAIKSKQTATSHLLPLYVTLCCTHRKREGKYYVGF